MFGTFSIFWSTLIFYISSPAYNWGTFEAGILAIFGLSGAVAAPIVGRLADSYSERKIVYMGLVMQTISFIALLVGGSHLAILLLAIILLDVGNQFGQVANQTRVQGLGEAASNRNNTVFMFMYFIGGAAGSLLGTTMWQQYGWLGVTVSGLVFQGCAFFFQFVVFREKKKTEQQKTDDHAIISFLSFVSLFWLDLNNSLNKILIKFLFMRDDDHRSRKFLNAIL